MLLGEAGHYDLQWRTKREAILMGYITTPAGFRALPHQHSFTEAVQGGAVPNGTQSEHFMQAMLIQVAVVFLSANATHK
jgi:hypothetical protein